LAATGALCDAAVLIGSIDDELALSAAMVDPSLEGAL